MLTPFKQTDLRIEYEIHTTYTKLDFCTDLLTSEPALEELVGKVAYPIPMECSWSHNKSDGLNRLIRKYTRRIKYHICIRER
jgi:hypothetical protein